MSVNPRSGAERRPARQRRPAEEARRAILDATERRLAQVGLAGIRLQDVAAEVGISHPAILHHFGSREGLLQALIERTLRRLRRDLVAAVETMNADQTDAAGVLEKAFAVLADRGQARLFAWLLLSGQAQELENDESELLRDIVEAIHRVREVHVGPADFEETRFAVLLAGAALFGDAIAGRALRRSAGLRDHERGAVAFRKWLAERLFEYLTRPRSHGERGRPAD